jgi:replicative DNA helicase
MSRLQDSLEENVLTLLCWNPQHAAQIALQATPDLFSTREYRHIAEEAHRHLERFGQPPGVHLRDLLEKRLRKGEEGQLLRRTIDDMERVHSEIQVEFVIETLDRFIATRKLAMALEEAADALNQGELEKAQDALAQPELAPRHTAGIWLHDPAQAMAFMDKGSDEFFSSGIDTLDDLGIRPARGTLTVLIAAAKAGKSWYLIECAKRNLLQRKKILHISLENGEDMTAKRYLQAFFGMTDDPREANVRTPQLTRDTLGRCLSIEFESRTADVLGVETRRHVAQRLRSLHGKLLIKEFPTSTLTMGQYNAYLDMLERTQGFVPDLVIIDYPDLFAFDADKTRTEIGRIFRHLRGVAQQRNHALVTVTQGNRSSGNARTVTTGMVSEDWSKIGTADTVLTFSQTSEEFELGLARILVAAARHARDKYLVLITQSYATGQFCLDSCYMSKFLEAEINRMSGKSEDEE